MSGDQHNDLNALLLHDYLREQRKSRFWKNLRFIAWFLLIGFIVFNIMSGLKHGSVMDGLDSGKKVGVLRLNGMIAPGHDFSAEEVVPILYDMFSDKQLEGVVLVINSPGGTPVQAAIIHDAILLFKKKFHKKVIAVGEDTLTSGAYYVAVAADTIYVNPNTLTGSIGVVMKGFGFVDTLKKLGIERRVYISGDEKDRLDPFLPQSPDDIIKIKEVMNEVHQNFVKAVLAGRKNKIHGDASRLFNGDFWSGESAIKLGLVDGSGNLLDVLYREFKIYRYREFGRSNNVLKMLGGQLSSSSDISKWLQLLSKANIENPQSLLPKSTD